MAEPTFVLVHGAWHGAWCWRDVTTELDRRDISWRSVDLPSSQTGGDPMADLAADAAVVVAAASTGGPVILVGHSYGGAVITEAAPSIAILKRLIYIAALVPEIGQSATDTSRLVRVRTELDSAIEVDGPLLRLNREPAALALYQDSTSEIREWASSQLSTQTLASFRSVRSAAPVGAFSRFVLCRHDQAIDPSLQELLAGLCDEVLEINSDHSPFLSHPVELCEALLA